MFDTISVCFSKGLGAPVGSALLGTKEQIDRALRIRKMLEVVCGKRAIWPLRLVMGLHTAKDGRPPEAKALGEAVKAVDGVRYLAPVDTNIVIFEFTSEAREKAIHGTHAKMQIQLINMGSGKLRFVTHLDYSNDQHAYVLQCMKQFK